MGQKQARDAMLALLSVEIGMIMEDHVDAAVSALPSARGRRERHFIRLERAGQDIMALAAAARVLVRISQ